MICCCPEGHEAELIDDFKGLARRSPWFALVMATSCSRSRGSRRRSAPRPARRAAVDRRDQRRDLRVARGDRRRPRCSRVLLPARGSRCCTSTSRRRQRRSAGARRAWLLSINGRHLLLGLMPDGLLHMSSRRRADVRHLSPTRCTLPGTRRRRRRAPARDATETERSGAGLSRLEAGHGSACPLAAIDGTPRYVVHPGAVMIVPISTTAGWSSSAVAPSHRPRRPRVPRGQARCGRERARCGARELFEERVTARGVGARRVHPQRDRLFDRGHRVWFARGLVPGERTLDAVEFLDVGVATRPSSRPPRRAGRSHDAKTLVGLLWLQRGREGRGRWRGSRPAGGPREGPRPRLRRWPRLRRLVRFEDDFLEQNGRRAIACPVCSNTVVVRRPSDAPASRCGAVARHAKMRLPQPRGVLFPPVQWLPLQTPRPLSLPTTLATLQGQFLRACAT